MKKSLRTAAAIILIIATALSLTALTTRFKLNRAIDTLITVFQSAMTEYVEIPDEQKLVESGVHAMMRHLDPYSAFIPQEDIGSLNFLATGGYAGVGAMIRRAGDYTLIAELYPNTPSAKAGLQVGDTILAIDSASTKGLDLSTVSDRLKGAPGTIVQIRISRPYGPKDTTYYVTRDQVHVPAVPWFAMVNNSSIGYVFLRSFTTGCAKEIELALDSLNRTAPNGLTGIILDLRGNAGGIIDEAQRIVNLFVPHGDTVFQVRKRGGELAATATTEGTARYPDLPLAVLTDRMSASSSEIVAGALQDLDRAIIIGERTFGKGLIQSTRPLEYGGSIKITTARYYTPSGRCIQALDYSNLTPEGAVGTIPDSLISQFFTRNGRSVYNGGGIYPDILHEAMEYTLFPTTLFHNHAFFDFATQFCAKHPVSPNLNEFQISDSTLNQFAKFCQAQGLDARSTLVDELNRVINLMKGQDQIELLNPYVDSVQKALKTSFPHYFERYKKQIAQLLTEEIASRYHHMAGRIAIRTRHDPAIDTAMLYINNHKLRDSILLHVSPKDPRASIINPEKQTDTIPKNQP